jgi:protein TonB
MIKYQSNYDEDGIHFLPHRFYCYITKDDLVFKNHVQYLKRLEFASIISLTVLSILFLGWKRMEVSVPVLKKAIVSIDVYQDIPQTVQQNQIPAPSRPTVPIASEDEAIPEDETIEFTNINFEEVPPPPPPPQEEIDESIPVFVPFDEPPAPIGGIAAIQQNLVYPEVARLAGVQGTVLLHLQIDEKGIVKNVRVINSVGLEDMDQAAINAVRAVKWKPARQRDLPIMVWYSVPIRFALSE